MITNAETFIEKLEVDVYPITIVKFLLNKKRILSYFSRVTDEKFLNSRFTYTLDTEKCKFCKEKPNGMMCRQHTSIQRVLEGGDAAFDLDTNAYFLKNEIFRMVGDKLVIIYCPHSKLISGEITDVKVRRIQPITVVDEDIHLPVFKERSFISSELLNQQVKCWFNDTFSIVTLPEDRNYSNWCLIPNK